MTTDENFVAGVKCENSIIIILEHKWKICIIKYIVVIFHENVLLSYVSVPMSVSVNGLHKVMVMINTGPRSQG